MYLTLATQNRFFFLVQSEDGDLFKLTVDYQKDTVRELKIKYFDTVPLSNYVAFLKAGFLFVASEFSNHHLYQITGLGDDETQPEFSSSQFAPGDATGAVFETRLAPLNLTLLDDVDSLCPIMDAKVIDMLGEDTPQIYTLCGRGSRSSLRTMRYGLEVTQVMSTDLPANPIAVWTVKQRLSDERDTYLLVSFINATLVLSIGETVEEVTNSGFVSNKPTLSVSQLGEDSMLQVYAEGIRHIRADKRVNEWKAPAGRTIVRAAANERQVIIALAGGELIYFELDVTGQLNEFQDRKELHSEVASLALGPVPEGRVRSRFVSVGCMDNSVRILSLDPEDCLQSLGVQALPTHAESLCITELPDQEGSGALYLFIGLVNGVLLRTVLDGVNGQLSDTRTRYVLFHIAPMKKLNLFLVADSSALAR